MAVALRCHRGLYLAAHLRSDRAAIGKGTADDLLAQARHAAADFRQLGSTVEAERRSELWHCPEKALRIGMHRPRKDLVNRRFLDLAAGIHDDDSLGHL